MLEVLSRIIGVNDVLKSSNHNEWTNPSRPRSKNSDEHKGQEMITKNSTCHVVPCGIHVGTVRKK